MAEGLNGPSPPCRPHQHLHPRPAGLHVLVLLPAAGGSHLQRQDVVRAEAPREGAVHRRGEGERRRGLRRPLGIQLPVSCAHRLPAELGRDRVEKPEAGLIKLLLCVNLRFL